MVSLKILGFESNSDEAESTNERVKWFSLLLMFGIIALGAWQVSLGEGIAMQGG